jgi:hypothetical protein
MSSGNNSKNKRRAEQKKRCSAASMSDESGCSKRSDFRNFKVIADPLGFYSLTRKTTFKDRLGEEMRQWLKGYFKGNLPISHQQNTGPFHHCSSAPGSFCRLQARNDNAEEEARLNAEQEEKGRQEMNGAHR